MANKKKHSVLRIARILCASIVLLAFILLFLDFGGIFDKVLGWLPKLQFWPAVISLNAGVIVLLVSLTLIFGRVYCSFLCPLGITQDLIYFTRTRGEKKRKYQQNYSKAIDALRYTFLALFILGTIAGTVMGTASLVYLIEPYSIFGRIMGSLLGKSLVVGIITLITFGVIVFLVWKYGRTWCNTVCPVGSLLGLLSRFSILKLSINRNKCVNCGLCGKGCRSGCIDT
ncbi:MAG: 4Fe-4S binding protein, partial [Bacteroidales bacterium]|nr:4Fe-4S binding protein [Bacteroidales bacterium]